MQYDHAGCGLGCVHTVTTYCIPIIRTAAQVGSCQDVLKLVIEPRDKIGMVMFMFLYEGRMVPGRPKRAQHQMGRVSVTPSGIQLVHKD